METASVDRRPQAMIESFRNLARGRREGLADRIGSKAASLIDLMVMGAKVPGGFCIETVGYDAFLHSAGLADELDRLSATLPVLPEDEVPDHLEATRAKVLEAPLPDALAGALQAQLERFDSDTGFAVRSSGTKEDMADASFAGVYETVLNVVGPDALADAIRTCWASVLSPRVVAYATNRGVDLSELSMGVIVQRMVAAGRSGVMFTANPLSGRDTEVVVESCFGLGEAVVGGEVTPHRHIYDWEVGAVMEESGPVQAFGYFVDPSGGGVVRRELIEEPGGGGVLEPGEVERVAEEGVRIQAEYGHPVDIEWALEGEDLYILQARPVTSIGFEGVEGQWTTADFKDGGVSSAVCSPMMWSLYDFIWERTLPAYLYETRLITETEMHQCWGRMFFGRPFWNAGAVKTGARRVPGFVERSFDEDLGIRVGYRGNGHVTRLTPATLLRGVRVLLALSRSFKRRLAKNERFAPRARQIIDELERVDPRALTREDLFPRLEELLQEHYCLFESTYFNHIFDNSNVQTLFKQSLSRYGEAVEFLNLTLGLEDLSHMVPNYELWDLSRAIRADPDRLRFYEGTEVEDLVALLHAEDGGGRLPDLAAFVEKFKYHSTRELDITVPNYRDDPRFVVENLKRLLELDDESCPRAQSERQRRVYEREAAEVLRKTPFPLRRSMRRKIHRMRRFLWWREELRDYSTQMYDQIRRYLLAAGAILEADGVLEEEGDVFLLTRSQLLAYTGGRRSAVDLRARVAKSRRYYRSFRNYAPPADIGFDVMDSESPTAEGGFTGIPCSPGVVTGIARVVEDIYSTDRLQAGEILVTRYTDPGWTPVFSRIAGVVTETGGTLSHSAVISREYGIPAVLGIDRITELVEDGQRITVDGSTGRVLPSSEPA